MSKAHVLLVDDEDVTLQEVKAGLELEGFHVTTRKNGRTALELLNEEKIDLIVLDNNMPFMTGREMLAHLRAASNSIPVIFFTQHGDDLDEVLLIEQYGIYYYIRKPFSIRKLAVYIRNILRQQALWLHQIADAKTLVSDDNALRVNTESRRVELHGKEISLGPKATDLLIYLMRRSGKYHTHFQLYVELWGGEIPDFDTAPAVMAKIREIRRELDETAQEPRYIGTERGVGYTFLRGARAG